MRWAAGLGLAGEERRGSDFREQPGGGVQLVGSGDGAGCLALEQAHQLVHEGELVVGDCATAQVLQGDTGKARKCRASRRGAYWGPGRRWRPGFTSVGVAAAPGPREGVVGGGREVGPAGGIAGQRQNFAAGQLC